MKPNFFGLAFLLTIASNMGYSATGGNVLLTLETPVDGGYYASVETIRGWALTSNGEGISRVEMCIDGDNENCLPLPMGALRQDVEDEYPSVPDSKNSGFSTAYNFKNLDPGSHTIEVSAYAATETNVSRQTVTINTSRFQSTFDENVGNNAPVDLSSVIAYPSVADGTDHIRLDGVVVNGNTYDVVLTWSVSAQTFEITNIQTVGISAQNTLEPQSDVESQSSMVEQQSLGNLTILNLESPVTGHQYGGVSNIRGWALAPNGIDRIELYIDDAFVSNIPGGGYRKDVSIEYPGIDGSELSGFSMAYNFSNLTPEAHEIRVRVLPNQLEGEASVLPSSAIATVVTTRYGSGNYYSDLEAIDVSGATITATGSSILIDGFQINGQVFNIKLTWRQEKQGFALETVESMSVDVPAIPSRPSASDDNLASNVTITWSEVTGSDDYEVYRCISDSTEDCGNALAQTADLSYVDDSADASKVYYYRIKACSGDTCSDFSEFDEGHRGNMQVGPTTTPNAPPAPYIALNMAGVLKVAWDSVANADHYKLYRCETDAIATCPNDPIATSAPGGSGRDFSDVNAPAQGDVFYRVRSCNAADECSALSDAGKYRRGNDDQDNEPDPTGQLPNSPTRVVVNDGKISWSAVSSATNYDVYRCSTSAITSCANQNIKKVNAPTTVYQDSAVAVGTHYYRISACNTIGCSLLSAPADEIDESNQGGQPPGGGTINPPPTTSKPSTPSTIHLSSGMLRWGKVSTATRYEIFRCETGSRESCPAVAHESVSSNVTEYTDTTAKIGQFYYRITACNAYGCSSLSAAKKEELQGDVAPPKPRLLWASDGASPGGTSGSDKVRLAWVSVGSDIDYKANQCKSDGSDCEVIGTVKGGNAFSNGAIPASVVYGDFTENTSGGSFFAISACRTNEQSGEELCSDVSNIDQGSSSSRAGGNSNPTMLLMTLPDVRTISTATSPVDLGNTAVDGDPTTASILVWNTGNQPLNLTGYTNTGTHADSFSATIPSSVDALSSHTITLQFAPTEGGVNEATMNVQNNSSNDPYGFKVRGSAQSEDCTDPMTSTWNVPEECSPDGYQIKVVNTIGAANFYLPNGTYGKGSFSGNQIVAVRTHGDTSLGNHHWSAHLFGSEDKAAGGVFWDFSVSTNYGEFETEDPNCSKSYNTEQTIFASSNESYDPDLAYFNNRCIIDSAPQRLYYLNVRVSADSNNASIRQKCGGSLQCRIKLIDKINFANVARPADILID